MSQYVSPILTAPDHAVIESLLYCEGGHAGPRSFALRRKLADAVIVQPDNVAPHIVTLHSRVRFRIDGGPPEERTLVVGAANDVPGQTVLAWTSRGLALLGTSAGQQVTSLRLDGTPEIITVEAVLYQPEADRRQLWGAPFDASREPGRAANWALPTDRPFAARRANDVVLGPDSDDWGPGAA